MILLHTGHGGGSRLAEIGANLLADPLSVILLLVGALITGASVAVLGYLVTGAVYEALIPRDIGRQPPEAE